MYQRILVPIDGSPTSDRGLGEAIRLAKLTDGRLRLIHVIDELSMSFGFEAFAGCGNVEWLDILKQNGVRIVEAAKAVVRSEHIEVDAVLEDSFGGLMHELVTAQVRKWGADLIVLGTHGRRGIGRLMLGSGAENILRHAPVPVLLVRMREVAEDVSKEGALASVDSAPAKFAGRR